MSFSCPEQQRCQHFIDCNFFLWTLDNQCFVQNVFINKMEFTSVTTSNSHWTDFRTREFFESKQQELYRLEHFHIIRLKCVSAFRNAIFQKLFYLQPNNPDGLFGENQKEKIKIGFFLVFTFSGQQSTKSYLIKYDGFQVCQCH